MSRDYPPSSNHDASLGERRIIDFTVRHVRLPGLSSREKTSGRRDLFPTYSGSSWVPLRKCVQCAFYRARLENFKSLSHVTVEVTSGEA